jgi:transposase-like protein
MRFSEEIVWRCLYLYFKLPVSLRDVVEMMRDRGVTVHHTSIYRWVLKFGPILEERFRKHKMPVNVSWRMDETYIKVNGQWKYLYRAVDKFGQTIDFLLRTSSNLPTFSNLENLLKLDQHMEVFCGSRSSEEEGQLFSR